MTNGITVIVPTYKRDDILPDTIAALESDIPHEIFVVKDGGESNYKPSKSNVECISIAHKGFRPSMLRNVAAGAAHYRQLVFLDDDCLPDHGFLDAYYNAYQKDKILFGRIDYWERDLSKKAQSDPRRKYGSKSNWRLWTGNWSIPKKLYWQLGGLHPNFDKKDEIGEAMAFEMHARRNGYETQFVKGASVRHRGRLDSKDSVRLQVSPNPSKKEYYKLR
jgi:glycosyltransferase involved in cell wall biosynthesis